MLSRRRWLAGTAQLGIAAAISRWVAPARLGSQSGSPPPGPPGHDGLIRRSLRPEDYETPVALLDAFITPNEAFYVRSHLPMPVALDEGRWTLSLDGNVAAPLSLSMTALRALPSVSITTTLECAGNGRAFFDPPVAGVQWQKGAVGTARWTGVRLADVLTRAGVRPSVRNIVMTPGDTPLGSVPRFVRQLPIGKALAPETILAYEMNGAPIPPAHGFPLRVIVPGWEGAYSVKWLTGLTAIDSESDSFWVATAYRYPVRRLAPGAAVDSRDMAPLAGLAVKSLITRPEAGAILAPGPMFVAGFAWAGEADIERVDISTDSGATWRPAQLVGERLRFTWRRFEYRFTPGAVGSYLILSRATDSAGVSQPAVAHWNPSGYLWNQWDAVRVEISNAAAGGSAPPPPAGASVAPSSGPGAETFNRACSACHETDLVDQQRLSRVGWQREVEKMTRWGAPVAESEKDTLVDYLLARTTRR